MGDSHLESQFTTFRNTWWPEIQQTMESVVSDNVAKDSPLRHMFGYHLNTGGKRLRAILPLLIAETLGTSAAKVVPFAAACEMLHNASLVHDDIQDGDAMRRGHPSVWKKYGISQAINLGDAMIAFALLLPEYLEVEASLRERAKSRILREMLHVIDGQTLEFSMQADGQSGIEDYIRMVEAKTSSLFALPLGGAALLSEAEDVVEAGLIDSACQIGVLFQIQDDIVDIYSMKKSATPGQDIRDGKPNVLAVHYLESSDTSETKARVLDILAKPVNDTTDKDVDIVRDAFREAGSLDFALTEIKRRRDAALILPQVDKDKFHALVKVLEQACDMFLMPVTQLVAQIESQ